MWDPMRRAISEPATVDPDDAAKVAAYGPLFYVNRLRRATTGKSLDKGSPS
jgi:hypothetical protein